MLRTLLVLPDGREIFSGAPGPAVVSARLTRNTNETVDLKPGTVRPDLLECTLVEAEELGLRPGQALTMYYVDDQRQRHLQGIFLVQTVYRTPKGLTLTAKDRLVLLDRDLSDLIQQPDFWPQTVGTLVSAICRHCGLEVVASTIPLPEDTIWDCAKKRATGTQLMRWIAQLMGCYCRADEAGRLVFKWFSMNDIALTAANHLIKYEAGSLRVLHPCSLYHVDTQLVFFGMETAMEKGRLKLWPRAERISQFQVDGSMELAEFETAGVERVRLKAYDEDPGIYYPNAESTGYTYILQDNPLLAFIGPAQQEAMAQRIYEGMQWSAYSPCTMRLKADPNIKVGMVYLRQDELGRLFNFLVMHQVIEGAQMELRCTGRAAGY